MAKFAFSIMDANNNHIPVTSESTSMVSARTLLGDSLSLLVSVSPWGTVANVLSAEQRAVDAERDLAKLAAEMQAVIEQRDDARAKFVAVCARLNRAADLAMKILE